MTEPARTSIPYGAWPRGLGLGQAAVYVGVSPTKFLAEVEAGLWPKPETRKGRKVWDRHVIDRYWDRRLDGETGTDAIMEALDDHEDQARQTGPR